MQNNKKHILLVDGSLYAYRAYHALPELSSRDGRPTGAIFGVINTLMMLPNRLDAEYIVVAFDALNKNFRHELYPAYKHHRQSMDSSLKQQFEVIFYIVEKLGLKCFVVEGYEADDVIGTLARQFALQGHKISIMTADKDLLQLIDDNISVIDGTKLTNHNNAFTKFNVKPHQIVDYLALVGDASDNIPGVKHIGPKTAAKLLQDYSSVEGIMAHIGALSPKIRQYLLDGYQDLIISKKLATIDCSVPIKCDLESLHIRKQDTPALIKIFRELNFNKFISMLKTGYESIKISFEISNIASFEDLADCLKHLSESKMFSFVIDEGKLTLCSEKNRVFHIDYSLEQLLDHDFITQLFALKTEKITLDLKSQLKHIANSVDITKLRIHDILIESYVYDSSQSPHTLQHIAAKYFNYYQEFNRSEQAAFIIMAHQFLQHNMDADSIKLYMNQELPLVNVLYHMETRGVVIDLAVLQLQDQALQDELTILQEKAEELSGEYFNVASPKQVSNILYKKLGLPIIEKTSHLLPSTNEHTLVKLSSLHPLPAILLQHRHLSKLRSSYTAKFASMIDKKTGRLHTYYNQNTAITGRLTSSSPNLQNIPVKTPIGQAIRRIFKSDKNYLLLSADYSQIELKVMAHLSQDEKLIAAFKENLDIHAKTASEVFDTDINQITADQRRMAKRINFGLIYGISPFGLAQQLNISTDKAKDYIERYFSLYPDVRNYMHKIITQAQQHGFVETLFKRKIHIVDIFSDNSFIRKGAERLAINAPIQGSAAEIIKKAMNDIYQSILIESRDIFLLMQVHDELVFEIREERISEFIRPIQDMMEQAVALAVPLNVNIKFGKNWGELNH